MMSPERLFCTVSAIFFLVQMHWSLCCSLAFVQRVLHFDVVRHIILYFTSFLSFFYSIFYLYIFLIARFFYILNDISLLRPFGLLLGGHFWSSIL